MRKGVPPRRMRYCRICSVRILIDNRDGYCDECRPARASNGHHEAPDRERRFCGGGLALRHGCGVRLGPGEEMLCGQCREVQGRAAGWEQEGALA